MPLSRDDPSTMPRRVAEVKGQPDHLDHIFHYLEALADSADRQNLLPEVLVGLDDRKLPV